MARHSVKHSESKDRKAVGLRLRQIRRQRRMTQKAFAEMLELSLRAYGNYERGERDLPRRHQLNIIIKTGEDPFCLQNDRVRPSAYEGTSRVRASWIGSLHAAIISLPAWRQGLIDQMEQHCNAIYSHRARRRIKVEDNTLAAATIYAWLHLQIIHFKLPVVLPVGEGSWGLLLLFGIVSVLLPRQMTRIVRFFRWRNSAA